MATVHSKTHNLSSYISVAINTYISYPIILTKWVPSRLLYFIITVQCLISYLLVTQGYPSISGKVVNELYGCSKLKKNIHTFFNNVDSLPR